MKALDFIVAANDNYYSLSLNSIFEFFQLK